MIEHTCQWPPELTRAGQRRPSGGYEHPGDGGLDPISGEGMAFEVEVPQHCPNRSNSIPGKGSNTPRRTGIGGRPRGVSQDQRNSP